MPLCTNCGSEAGQADKFCKACGQGTSSSSQTQTPRISPLPTEPGIERHIVSETSRLSGVGIEKFLAPNERIVHSTPGRIEYAGSSRYVYITNTRVLFYKRDGAIIKHDRLDEVSLNGIRTLKLVEEGMLRKKIYLALDEMELYGSRGDLLDLYRSLQAARAAA